MFDTPVIFYGANYDIALARARESIKQILGKDVDHPDLLEFQVEGKNYIKEQIAQFLSDVSLSPYQSSHKVYLFHHAEKMLPVHANALLKTFEEKPDHAVIMLVTENIKGILDTILSRSKRMYISSKSKEEKCEPVKQALLAIAKGDLYTCLDKIKEFENASLEEVSDTVFSWYRDLNLLKNNVSHDHLTYREAIEAFSVIKNIPSLEAVSRWIEQANLAFERYSRPKQIFEYLILNVIVDRYAVT